MDADAQEQGSSRSQPSGAPKSAATDAETSAAFVPEFEGTFDDEGRKRRGDEHAYPNARICTFEDAGLEITTGADTETAEDVRDYFAKFVAPIPHPRGGGACVHCGVRWAFDWGLAHGEGHCTTCGWPARMYHFAKDRHGADLFALRGKALQYRPMTAEEIAARDADNATAD